jgi:hypothetical protein
VHVTFEAEDHPERTTGPGLLPLVVAPTINNIVIIKMSVDGGEGLNLISTKLMGKLQITPGKHQPTGPFQGVTQGTMQPFRKITLPVTFGTKDKYVTFDMADIPHPYNGFLGHRALAQFMVVTHHAYNPLKMSSMWGVLIVKASTKDTMAFAERIYLAVATSVPGGVRSSKAVEYDPLLPLRKPTWHRNPSSV